MEEKFKELTGLGRCTDAASDGWVFGCQRSSDMRQTEHVML